MQDDRRLSDFFTLAECVYTSATHLDNTPTKQAVDNLTALCNAVMDPIRRRFGRLRVTSGYRSHSVNLFIHGSRNSQHTKGEAIDFVPLDAPDLFTVARWIASSDIPFDQLILEFIPPGGKGGWLHISHVSPGHGLPENRREIRRALKDAFGRTIYSQPLTPSMIPAPRGGE